MDTIDRTKVTAVNVVTKDIGQVQADCLITGVTSTGLWFGPTDAAIRRVAGGLFHGQLGMEPVLVDGQFVFTSTSRHHDGAFGHVGFIIDDWDRSLDEVVYSALVAASQQEVTSVSLPLLRGASMRSEAPEYLEVLQGLAQGVSKFAYQNHTTIRKINMVVRMADFSSLNAAMANCW